MKAKTPAERQRKQREKLKAAGITQILINTKPVHVKSIRAYAKSVNNPVKPRDKCWLTKDCDGEMFHSWAESFCDKCHKETGINDDV